MTEKNRKRAKEILGEGKIYEVEIYNGKVSTIATNQKHFTRYNGQFDEWNISIFDDVTDRDDSLIIKKIKEVFNTDIKILALCNSYVSKLHDGETSLKNKDNNLFVSDADCTYIVCTTGKKSKLKKFNVTPEDDIVIEDFNYGAFC